MAEKSGFRACSAKDFNTALIPAGRGYVGTDNPHIKDDG